MTRFIVIIFAFISFSIGFGQIDKSSDNAEKIARLQQKNEQIRELEKINQDLLNGNQNQAYLLRGSNLNKRV